MLPAYDPRIPAHRSQPLSLLGPLREAVPMAAAPAIGGQMILRFHDLQDALSDLRLGNARIRSYAAYLRARDENAGPIVDSLNRWMVFNDPPRQTELRLMVAKTFGIRNMRRIEDDVRTLVRRHIDTFASEQSTDLLDALAVPLPTRVIARLLGLPEADAPMLKRWSDEIALFVGTSLDVADRRLRAESAVLEMRAYLEAQAESGRPQGLLAVMLEAELDGHRVTPGEAADIALGLAFAGHETTTHLLGNGIRNLLLHGCWPSLCDGSLSAADAIEECLRFEGPVNAVARVVREPHDRFGVRLEPGDRVFLMLGAANRDPRRFADPDTFRPDRRDHKHLAFGFGPHFCLGALLARLESRIALEELAARFPRLALLPNPPEWMDSLVLRGLTSLPVSLR